MPTTYAAIGAGGARTGAGGDTVAGNTGRRRGHGVGGTAGSGNGRPGRAPWTAPERRRRAGGGAAGCSTAVCASAAGINSGWVCEGDRLVAVEPEAHRSAPALEAHVRIHGERERFGSSATSSRRGQRRAEVGLLDELRPVATEQRPGHLRAAGHRARPARTAGWSCGCRAARPPAPPGRRPASPASGQQARVGIRCSPTTRSTVAANPAGSRATEASRDAGGGPRRPAGRISRCSVTTDQAEASA